MGIIGFRKLGHNGQKGGQAFAGHSFLHLGLQLFQGARSNLSPGGHLTECKFLLKVALNLPNLIFFKGMHNGNSPAFLPCSSRTTNAVYIAV